MGSPIEKEFFEPEEYIQFKQKCIAQVEDLKSTLTKPNFSCGPQMFGCEVEFSMIQADGSPAFINKQVIDTLNDSRWQSELNRYNLECNLVPMPIQGTPFTQLESDILTNYQSLNDCLATFDAQALMVGILPTVTEQDIGPSSMTPELRYKALCHGVKALKAGPVQIDINGQQPLEVQVEDLTVEGANTSIQLHLQVTPDSFVDWHNAIQLATPLAVAISGNSPLFLGHLLWDETRVAVFKQALESRRDQTDKYWRQPHRVSFGYGWLRQDASEYFQEMVHMYQPLLPVITEQDSRPVPTLDELRLHNGTIWRWNRGIYDPQGEGHLRIEMRSLPAGPSVPDMVASAAFLIGLAAKLKENIHKLLPAFPFMFCEYNFYRASQSGFDAKLLWPDLKDLSPKEHEAASLATALMPWAKEGLLSLGVEENEAQQWITVAQQKSERKISGATWIRQTLAKYPNLDKHEALKKVTLEYLSRMQQHQSVLEW